MASIDKKYHRLLQTILDEGFTYEDPNRKGVKRIQIPSVRFEHQFVEGFPAITTKKLFWRGVVGELLWFLRGSSDIRELWKYDIKIWDKDWYNFYSKSCSSPYTLGEMKERINEPHQTGFDLGRVYGTQWRNWLGRIPFLPTKKDTRESYDGTKLLKNYYLFDEVGHWEQPKQKQIFQGGIDQISNLIKGLKENPMGTKHIVTAWNPTELDEMALPPCHWSFEVLVEPLDYNKRYRSMTQYQSDTYWSLSTISEESGNEHFDNCGIPKYQVTLKWHQRSVDTFLGLPFNIASYALLAHIIGKMTNMVPKGIIGDLSNVHIYETHLGAVKQQLSRDVNKHGKCELEEFTGFKMDMHGNFDSWINNREIEDFKLKNYECYPTIQAEMLPYNK